MRLLGSDKKDEGLGSFLCFNFNTRWISYASNGKAECMHVFTPLREYFTLENGLQVVAVPLANKSGVIEVDLLYKVGSRNEHMGKSGIAHMLEHMSFKSTKHLKEGEFDTIVKGFGGISNASTSFDNTRYFIKASNANSDKSLELFAEMMGSLQLKEDEFLPERQVVAEIKIVAHGQLAFGLFVFSLF